MKVKMRVHGLERFRRHIHRIEIEAYGVDLSKGFWGIEDGSGMFDKCQNKLRIETGGWEAGGVVRETVCVPLNEIATVTFHDYDKVIADATADKKWLLATILSSVSIIQTDNTHAGAESE